MRNNLNLLLQRLALLRLSIATIWLMFLVYLQYRGFAGLGIAWGLLAVYLPLLLVTGWQGVCSEVRDWHLLLHLVAG